MSGGGDTLRVARRRCDQCLFSSAKVVDDERKAEVLADCERSGGYFECHKFSIAGETACCRAFFDLRLTIVVRLALMLGRVEFVDLPDDG